MIKLEDWDDEEVEETEDPQSYIKTTNKYIRSIYAN